MKTEWKRRLGNDYAVARELLRPLESRALSYPCLADPPCGCDHRVVRHDPETFVAVCDCQPRQCDPVHLTSADLVVYEWNLDALAVVVSDALGFRGKSERHDHLSRVLRIGEYVPAAGYEFPAYLVVEHEPSRSAAAIDAVLGSESNPFILVTPTADVIGLRHKTALRTRGCPHVTLQTALRYDDKNGMHLSEDGQSLLSRFGESQLPPGDDESPVVPFLVPPGSSWSDVVIRFIDEHTVSVRVKNVYGQFHFLEMGMGRKRNKTPTVQWDLLRSFAEGRGMLDWNHPDASRKNKKRLERLAHHLKVFFKIYGEPFRLNDDREPGKGWQARFQIMPP